MPVTQNMQVHTVFSSCAKREMEIPAIFEEAHAHGLELIAFTDHLNTPEQWDIPSRVREQMVEPPPGLAVLVGCEAQMTAPDRVSITPEVAAKCDVVLIACNHYHLRSVEGPEQGSAADWAAHHLAMIEGAIDTGFCDVIPHPFVLGKVADRVDVDAVLASYDWNALSEILCKAAERRVAFELNPSQVERHFDFMRRIVQEGRAVGCRFSIGSDAHQLKYVGYDHFPGGIDGVEDLLERLGLDPDGIWAPAKERAH